MPLCIVEQFDCGFTRRFGRHDRFQEDVIREPTHGGTHLDSPVHFYRGGISVAEIPLERMLGVPVAAVDVRDKAALNASYELTVGDLRAWERQHGRLPDGCLLFVNTGWSKAR